ncbi:MAG: glutathione S-transferase [Gammaproteobacteria bacterium]|nr:MAG: glutathione S-transferase [Gammaproteobacteria bacterium]
MQLFGSTTSPFVRKVRVILALKQIEYRFENTIPWEDDSPVHQLNPLSKVPVLRDPGGQIWYDSALIADLLDTRYPEARLIPEDPELRLLDRQYQVLADGICDAGVLIFLERKRDPAQQNPAWIARQEKKIEKGIDALADRLENRAFLAAEKMTVADIAALCTLEWLDIRAGMGSWKAAHPKLADWVARHTAEAPFASTRPQA